MPPERSLRIVTVLLAVLAGSADGCGQSIERDPLERWLAQLDGETFEGRERAAAHITSLGRPAIHRVAEVTQTQRLEPSLRAVQILADMCLAPDEATWRAAEAALLELADGPNCTAAFIVRDLLRTRESSAAWRLEQLGAKPIQGRSILTLPRGWQGDAHGLVYLRWLPRITSLRVESVDLHPEAMRHLRWAPQLRDLVIIDCPVDDRVFPFLNDLPRLRHLYLNGTKITDEGLATLRDRQQLTWLEVQQTQISDASLPTLATLTGLKGLRVHGSDISPAGVEWLQQQLPGANIWWDE